MYYFVIDYIYIFYQQNQSEMYYFVIAYIYICYQQSY